MSKIQNNLFLGNKQNAEDLKFLTNNHITHIVNVTEECQPKFKDKFTYLHIKVQDIRTYNYSAHFDRIADFIHESITINHGTVLVHCYYGINRSTTAVICYLVKYYNMSSETARDYIKKRRYIIRPIYDFMRQLVDWESKLTGKPVALPSLDSKLLLGKRKQTQTNTLDNYFLKDKEMKLNKT